jgi:magnesium transporter
MSKPPLGLLQRLRTLNKKNEPDRLAKTIAGYPTPEVVWCFGRIPVEEKVHIFSSIPPEEGVKIFQEMDLSQQVEILKLGRIPAIAKIIQRMDSDDLADVLGELDPVEKVAWMGTLPAQELSEAQSLLVYPSDTAGGLMAKEYISVPVHLTAGEVAARLQSLAKTYEQLKAAYVYVIDEKGILKGVLPMRDLVLTSRDTPISEVMVKEVTTILDSTPEVEVAQMFRDLDLMALPVVTTDGKLLGVITSDDVIDLVQELANEEMLKLSGVSVEETRGMPLGRVVKKRLSWLTINIFLNLTAASVIWLFEDTLSAVIALAFFLPIISDMSGCSGMQAVAVSVRDLALQKLLPRDYFQVLGKEAMVGVLNGLVLGTIVGLVAFFLKGIPMLGVVVALALWINTIIAVSIGGVVPLFVKYFKRDPAIASGPILTTVTDIMGFFILLSLATIWLPWLQTSAQ